MHNRKIYNDWIQAMKLAWMLKGSGKRGMMKMRRGGRNYQGYAKFMIT